MDNKKAKSEVTKDEDNKNLHRMLEHSQRAAELRAAKDHAERLDERLRGILAAQSVTKGKDSATVCLGKEGFMTVSGNAARKILDGERMRLTDAVADAWQHVAVIENQEEE